MEMGSIFYHLKSPLFKFSKSYSNLTRKKYRMSYKVITEVGRYIPKINNTKNISTNGYHMDIYIF